MVHWGVLVIAVVAVAFISGITCFTIASLMCAAKLGEEEVHQ